MFIVKMADHDGNHRCLVEKNVPIALILPSRWRDGAESLGMEHTSCLCKYKLKNLKLKAHLHERFQTAISQCGTFKK